jgi:hypothetical protein
MRPERPLPHPVRCRLAIAPWAWRRAGRPGSAVAPGRVRNAVLRVPGRRQEAFQGILNSQTLPEMSR